MSHTNSLQKDRTARLSGTDHFTLKVISLHTGLSVKELISLAVPLLGNNYPNLKDMLPGFIWRDNLPTAIESKPEDGSHVR